MDRFETLPKRTGHTLADFVPTTALDEIYLEEN